MSKNDHAIKLPDALAIARAMVSQSIELSSTAAVPFYWCLFCDATLQADSSTPLLFEHDHDCPVRIADKIVREFDPIPEKKQLPVMVTA